MGQRRVHGGKIKKIMAIPANIEAALEKAPPQVQTYVKNVFGVLDNESELRSRSTACALAILSLWSISCFPYISIFVAIVAALDPPSVAPVAAMVEPQLRNILAKIPAMFVAPSAIGLLVVFYLISWFSWYLGLVVSLVFLVLGCVSAADRVLNLWNKEQSSSSAAAPVVEDIKSD